MGIFGALTTAVAGLRAQSFALENISGNIANSQTIAYKRVDTSFEDLIADSAPGKQNSGGVLAGSRATNNVQGDLQSASVGTYMAINGEGYFIIQKPSSFSDGRPVFESVDLYTRRGDFQMDLNGDLVNGAGYYLMGIPIDSVTGNPVGSVPQVLQFNKNLLSPVPTTQIDYAANLPTDPVTANFDADTPGSELLDPGSFTVNPLAAGSGTVVGDDASVFLAQSVTGGALTAYDTLGSQENIQFRWAKTDSVNSGGTDSWELFYQVDPNATGTNVAWQNSGTSFVFGADGHLDPVITSVPLANVTVGGHSLGDIDIQLGADGLTQFADANGTVQINKLQQNGSPAARLESISINDKNRIVGTFSNGQTVDLAQVTLATFGGENALQSLDGGAYAATAESGAPLYSASGKIVGAELEGSNTDIADEFTKLIVTQQAYSANTKVITTTNQMVQDLLNMLR